MGSFAFVLGPVEYASKARTPRNGLLRETPLPSAFRPRPPRPRKSRGSAFPEVSVLWCAPHHACGVLFPTSPSLVEKTQPPRVPPWSGSRTALGARARGFATASRGGRAPVILARPPFAHPWHVVGGVSFRDSPRRGIAGPTCERI